MTTATTPRSKSTSPEEILRRYPRLTAHLVCESLGYLTPRAAANAILSHIQAQELACEWYLDMARKDRSLIQVNENIISMAFRHRHFHTGFMADHRSALAMVEREINGGRPVTPHGLVAGPPKTLRGEIKQMPKTYTFAGETFTLESAGPGRSWVTPSDPGPAGIYGVIGINVHGTDRNPFCWSMNAGDSIPSGMVQGNISGSSFEHNLQALCGRIIEAQTFSQERSAFDQQRAMEEMGRFVEEGAPE